MGSKTEFYQVGVCSACPAGWERMHTRTEFCDGEHSALGYRYSAPTKIDCGCVLGERPGYQRSYRFGFLGQRVAVMKSDGSPKWQLCWSCNGGLKIEGPMSVNAGPEKFVSCGADFTPLDKDSELYKKLVRNLGDQPIKDKTGRYMSPDDYGFWRISFHLEVVEMKIERRSLTYDMT